VLLIDDSVESLIPLQGLLELDGHEVRLAHDGASGLAMARSFRPEFVLCDIGLPDIDGYEVARTIRGDALLREASVVALSGYAAPEHQRLAEEAGFDAHLAKPPDLELIARLVAEPPRSPGERD
jgi:two-component system CheB/CheR fusion protein